MPRVGDTRARILEVAEAEFASEGYAGAHLQKIAEQVGVRKTALYYYFDSKAALYTAVLETILEAFESAVGLLDDPGSFEQQLGDLTSRINDLLAGHPNYARILFRVFVDPQPPEVGRVLPSVQRVVERLMRFYRGGVDAGVFRRLSARHFFQSVFGMMLFHYAAPGFSATVLGVPDIFSSDVVAWRRDEALKLLREGALDPKSSGGKPG